MKAYIVDKQALLHNIEILKTKASVTPIYAVLKGNGYGLGLTQLAAILYDQGINRFAVTEPFEARELREAGYQDAEILMLRSTTLREELEELLDLHVVCTIGTYETAVAMNGIAQDRGVRFPGHLKIDTGMGRYGFLPNETDKILSIYEYLKYVDIQGVYTHFHSAFSNEKETYRQFNAFLDVTNRLSEMGVPIGIRHCANSSAFLKYPSMQLDAVRIGSAFLGRLSFPGSYGLKRIGYCEAQVEELRYLSTGSTVGYGAAWKARRPTRIAICGVGYYHGFGVQKGNDLFRFRDCARGCLEYLKALFTKKAYYATIGGKQARVLGHIGMVQTVLDVTDLDCGLGETLYLDINPLLVKGLPVIYR